MSKDEKPPSSGSNLSRLLAPLARFLPSHRAANKAEVLDTLRLAEEDGIVAQDAYAMMQRVCYLADSVIM